MKSVRPMRRAASYSAGAGGKRTNLKVAEGKASAQQIATAVLSYARAHPGATNLAVVIRGEKVIVKAGGGSRPMERKAPRGFFAPFYDRDFAEEDNRVSACSVVLDPADLPE